MEVGPLNRQVTDFASYNNPQHTQAVVTRFLRGLDDLAKAHPQDPRNILLETCEQKLLVLSQGRARADVALGNQITAIDEPQHREVGALQHDPPAAIVVELEAAGLAVELDQRL